MGNPVEYHFVLPQSARPPFVPLEQELHPSFQWLTRNRARSRQRDILNVVDTIVVHGTAGYATRHAIDRWKNVKASAHWIVPDEDEPQHGSFVWATVAEAKAAYHVGDVNFKQHLGPGPNVNNRSLGIEIVNTQDVQNFSDPYSRWQVTVAARIVLYAWAKYPRLRHVISHAKLDPSRRSDPGRNFPWNAFKRKILTGSALGTRNPLVTAAYDPPEPIEHTSNCCQP